MEKSKDLEELTLENRLAEHPLLQIIAKNGYLVLFAFLGLVAIFVLFERYQTYQHQQLKKDYFDAQSQLEILYSLEKKGLEQPETFEAPFNKLGQILSNHEELQPRYENLLAQILIENGKISSALPYAEASILRTQVNEETNPLYLFESFSRTSLLISGEDYESALTRSLKLQESLQSADLPTLLTFNTLRIASLYQHLEKHEKEKEIWKELDTKIKNKEFNSSFKLPLLIKNLSEGQLSFEKYINYRKNI